MIVGRSFNSCLAWALAAALVSCSAIFPETIAAASTQPPDLSKVVITIGPPGFVVAPTGTANTGAIDAQQFAALAGVSPPAGVTPSSFEAYIRLWRNSSQHESLVVVGARFPGVSDATDFLSGVRDAVVNKKAGVTATFTTPIPSSIGFTQQTAQVTGVAIAFAKGRYSFLVDLAAPAGGPAPSESAALSVAQRQLTAVPLDLGTSRRSTSIAYRIGFTPGS